MVVTFGISGAAGHCTVNPCPMGAYGPFDTDDEARDLAEQMFAWQQPHVLRLEAPYRAALAPATPRPA